MFIRTVYGTCFISFLNDWAADHHSRFSWVGFIPYLLFSKWSPQIINPSCKVWTKSDHRWLSYDGFGVRGIFRKNVIFSFFFSCPFMFVIWRSRSCRLKSRQGLIDFVLFWFDLFLSEQKFITQSPLVQRRKLSLLCGHKGSD